MSKGQEERFCYSEKVASLRQFLLEKMRRLKAEVEDETIPKKNASIARSYIKKVEQILDSEYFTTFNRNLKVYELMERLKNDDVIFEEAIKGLKAKIKRKEDYIQNSDEFLLPDSFDIPDEREAHIYAIEERKREFLWELEKIRDELRTYEYRLELCRKLKGIICRPNGFFSAVYKE